MHGNPIEVLQRERKRGDEMKENERRNDRCVYFELGREDLRVHVRVPVLIHFPSTLCHGRRRKKKRRNETQDTQRENLASLCFCFCLIFVCKKGKWGRRLALTDEFTVTAQKILEDVLGLRTSVSACRPHRFAQARMRCYAFVHALAVCPAVTLSTLLIQHKKRVPCFQHDCAFVPSCLCIPLNIYTHLILTLTSSTTTGC